MSSVGDRRGEVVLGIRAVESDREVAGCFGVMRELRTNLRDVSEFVERVRRQREQGYRLVAAMIGGECVGCAGYRVQENLIHGRHVYVDDLVVGVDYRRGGIGERLLEYVCGVARGEGCGKVFLDTPVTNGLGQRFYFRFGMLFTAMRFSVEVGGEAEIRRTKFE